MQTMVMVLWLRCVSTTNCHMKSYLKDYTCPIGIERFFHNKLHSLICQISFPHSLHILSSKSLESAGAAHDTITSNESRYATLAPPPSGSRCRKSSPGLYYAQK